MTIDIIGLWIIKTVVYLTRHEYYIYINKQQIKETTK